jgi:AcrR family transcriptional regulator
VSRERILDAAVEVLVEFGYAGASTLEIQRRAGVTRGRLTHHFPSRDELLVAAANHLASSRLEQLAEAETADSDSAMNLAERIDQAISYIWSTFQQDYFWAATELWLGARHSQGLIDALLPAERHLYSTVRKMIDVAFGTELVARQGYVACRELLFTSMRGVALTYAFDIRDPRGDPHLEQWRTAARVMLDVSV